MGFTDIFIRRPVLALVVSALILLLGLNALREVELRQFPKLEKSTISIVTAYPGASAKLVQGFITTPVQQAVASVEGLDYIESSTRQGMSQLTLHIELGFDGNISMMQVLSALAGIKAELPASAENPQVSKQTGSDTDLLYLSFFSDGMSPEQITEYLVREVQPKLQTLAGVAEAQLLGAKAFSMRIWIDQQRLASKGLDITHVVAALTANNHLASVGSTEGGFLQVEITADTDLQTVEGFSNLIISRKDGDLIRLNDVARVALAAENTNSDVIYNGRPAVFIGIKPTPGANPLTVADKVKQQLPAINKQMPSSMHSAIVYDVSEYINASIEEVLTTLVEAIAIVVLVVFLFLGSLRSVLIPVVTIPLSIIGVLFLVNLMGFSINLLTLLALVLAVGLVVDDAIVMVENVSRHIAAGLSPLDAARVGAREMAMPVISMTLTLAAVYAPIGFMGGLTGTLFKEFAFTLAAAVVISGVVALVLSPMMCSRILRHSEHGRLERFSAHLFQRLADFYQRRLRTGLQYRLSTLLVVVAVLGAIPYLWSTSQSELAPVEDQGILLFSGAAAKSASIDLTRLYAGQIGKLLEKQAGTQGYFLINGSPGENGVFGFQILKPWENRQLSQMAIQPQVQSRLAGVAGLKMVVFPMPSLPGSSGGMPVQFVITSSESFERLNEVGQALQQKAMASGLFAYAELDLKFDTPLARIEIDRSMANELGLSMEAIGQALALSYSGGYVDRFDSDERSYKVIPQLEKRWRTVAENVKNIQLQSARGGLVSLASVVDIKRSVGPESLAQFQQLNAASLSGVLLPGVSMGEAIAYLQNEADVSLPKGFTYDWAGESRDFIKEGNSLIFAFALALLVIFLVLAAQFDSLRDPFIVLLTVPMAIAGALVPVNLGFSSLNIYTQIGLVTLIGLISKQGILMVEFANQLRRTEGLSVNDAIVKSSTIRLRPILMTAAAIIIGVLPLVLADGAGAVGRRDLGMVVFFGMMAGTLLCLFTVPVVYSYLASRIMPQSADAQTERQT
jgi:multidrug efflux pump